MSKVYDQVFEIEEMVRYMQKRNSMFPFDKDYIDKGPFLNFFEDRVDNLKRALSLARRQEDKNWLATKLRLYQETFTMFYEGRQYKMDIIHSIILECLYVEFYEKNGYTN